MKRILLACLAVAALALPAEAVTVANGVVFITQADALAGGVTPGDTAGFPVTLSTFGSYRLASNLLVTTADVNAIEVTAPEVTIDLFGFRIAGSGLGKNGIVAMQRDLTVRNGTIRGFREDGILAVLDPPKAGPYLIAEDLRLGDNKLYGIEDRAGFARILNNTISGNFYGFICKQACHVEGNSFIHQTYGAMYINGGATVLGNTIIGNGSFPIYGFDSVTIGYGNNTIAQNGQAPTGNLVKLFPNACDNASC